MLHLLFLSTSNFKKTVSRFNKRDLRFLVALLELVGVCLLFLLQAGGLLLLLARLLLVFLAKKYISFLFFSAYVFKGG